MIHPFGAAKVIFLHAATKRRLVKAAPNVVHATQDGTIDGLTLSCPRKLGRRMRFDIGSLP